MCFLWDRTRFIFSHMVSDFADPVLLNVCGFINSKSHNKIAFHLKNNLLRPDHTASLPHPSRSKVNKMNSVVAIVS